MKRLIKKIVPRRAIAVYHAGLAHGAALRYSHPTRGMLVIGVTGTNGKTTVSNLITDILNEAGLKAACATTTNFRILDEDKLNDTKQTMLGRFKLQAFLRRARDAGCTHAVVETSSEGIVQSRHAAINYRAAVFTNLTPEHIESHGSYEAYRGAKGRLFAKVAAEHPHDGIGVYNLDSPDVDFFLQYAIPHKFGFTFEPELRKSGVQVLRVLACEVGADGSAVTVEFPHGQTHIFHLKLRGRVNVENALAALCVAAALGISFRVAGRALERVSHVPGRFEFIDEGQDFYALVDYAPEPESMRQLIEFLRVFRAAHGVRRVIHVTGSAGGGRDKSRRPVLGRMAAAHADIVVVTNEDPYDEDPAAIIDQVAAGALEAGKILGTNLFKIADRREAIAFALAQAQPHDLVVCTGKGSEQAIVVRNNKKIPWDEREVVREILRAR